MLKTNKEVEEGNLISFDNGVKKGRSDTIKEIKRLIPDSCRIYSPFIKNITDSNNIGKGYNCCRTEILESIKEMEDKLK